MVTEQIKETALQLGFELVGVGPAGRVRHADRFKAWLGEGRHGEMDWLARRTERRLDPREVVPGAKSVIMVGWHYYVEDPPAALWDDPLRGRIARYAWGPDYHDELLPKLMELAAFIRTLKTGDAQARAYVDTGPLLERTWAAEAGLGFVGKNTLLIQPERGSLLFLGGIITDLPLAYDAPAGEEGARQGQGTCGQCRRCLTICPTHAFPAPYILDSRRCISYLTIELKGDIPEALRPKMGNWIYGCDACQEVCPWVKRYSRPSPDRFLSFDPDRFAPDLCALITLDDAGFRKRYKGTPIQRTKRRGLLRNAAVALGNSGRKEAIPYLKRALNDPEPLIRAHVEWALRRLELSE